MLLTFAVVLLLAGALATTAGAQATVTGPDAATPTVTDPMPDCDPGARTGGNDAGADGAGALERCRRGRARRSDAS